MVPPALALIGALAGVMVQGLNSQRSIKAADRARKEESERQLQTLTNRPMVERSIAWPVPMAADSTLSRDPARRPVVVGTGRRSQPAPAAGAWLCPPGWRLGPGLTCVAKFANGSAAAPRGASGCTASTLHTASTAGRPAPPRACPNGRPSTSGAGSSSWPAPSRPAGLHQGSEGLDAPADPEVLAHRTLDALAEAAQAEEIRVAAARSAGSL